MPELPINTIIIIIICIAVFLAIAILFFSVWNKSYPGISLDAAKNNACQMLASMGCQGSTANIPVTDFDANKDTEISNIGGTSPTFTTNDCYATATTADNLATLCVCYYGKTSDLDCKNLCMCGGGGGGGGSGGCRESNPPDPCYVPSDCASPLVCVGNQCVCP